MESEARYTWVGAAMVALFLLAAAGLFWLSGATERIPGKRYTVYFQKQSLEGLQINSEVRMQGVKIGKVVDYAIAPGSNHRVRVVLEVDARAPVMRGIEAVVARHLVTGLAAIDLENVADAAHPLVEAPPGEDYPVIEEGVPQLTRVTDTLEELGQTTQEALTRFNTLLSDGNQRALHSTLENMSHLTGDLRLSVPELDATLSSARQAADQLRIMSDETAAAANRAGARFDLAASNMEATLGRAEDTLQTLSEEVRSLNMQLKLTADLGTQELQATGQSLRQAGDALQAAGQGVADPGRLLFGPSKGQLGPGEERP